MRLREKFKTLITSITVVTIGPPKASDVLRTALAMGADSAIHVEVPEGTLVDPLAVARCLKKIVGEDKSDLVILGKQAIDDDAGQVGGMLAGMLGWPQGNFASSVKLDEKGESLVVEREIDGGLETLSMKLPAVLTTDLRLNEPRYASLPNIMKVSLSLLFSSSLCKDWIAHSRDSTQAKKKPVKKMTTADLGIDIASRLTVLKVVAPPVRQGGSKVRFASLLLYERSPLTQLRCFLQVGSVDEVVAKLKEAGVL